MVWLEGIHLLLVLPEDGIKLKGGGAPFLALLIKHNMLLLTPDGAVTQKRDMGVPSHVSSSVGLRLLRGLPRLGSGIGRKCAGIVECSPLGFQR